MLVACLATQSYGDTTTTSTWTGAFGFEFWGIPANWNNGVPDAVGARAVFPAAAITTPTDVNLSNGPYTVGSLAYDGNQPLGFELGSLIFDQDGAGQAQIVLGSPTTASVELDIDVILADDLHIQSSSFGNSLHFPRPLGGAHNINLSGSGQVEFSGLNSTWTGQLNINDSMRALVSDPFGLGDTATGTVINGGRLTLDAATNEAVTVNGGLLFLNAGSTAGAVIINNGGTLDSRGSTGAVTVNDGGTVHLRTSSSVPAIFSNGGFIDQYASPIPSVKPRPR